MSERRQFTLLRDHLDLLAWSATAGHLTTLESARRMRAAGATLEMTRRALRRAHQCSGLSFSSPVGFAPDSFPAAFS